MVTRWEKACRFQWKRRTYLEKLANKSRTTCLRNPEELQLREVAEPVDEVPMDAPDDLAASRRIDKRKIDTRTSILGEHPRARREEIRAGLSQGFYICVSGKRSVRTLHLLGRYYLIPDVDYWRYSMRARNFLPKPRTTSSVRSVQKRGWLVQSLGSLFIDFRQRAAVTRVTYFESSCSRNKQKDRREWDHLLAAVEMRSTAAAVETGSKKIGVRVIVLPSPACLLLVVRWVPWLLSCCFALSVSCVEGGNNFHAFRGEGVGIGFSEPMLVHTWLRFGPKKAFKLTLPSCLVTSLRSFTLLQYSMSHVGMAASSLVAGVQVVPASVFIPITAEEKAAAPPMEPAMEALLRQANLHEDVIWKFRINELCDRELFVAIDRDEDGLRSTMKSDFGLDQEKGFAQKREVAKVVKAWNMAKVQSEVKVKADAAARAHGVPITMLEPDWALLFKNKYGSHIPTSALPAQSFFESFEEMVANGTLKGITLAHVVSAKEQEAQDEARPEPSRQMGLHLDSTLTIQTKRKYMSAMPSNTEELSQKYRIMSNCWLLAHMCKEYTSYYRKLATETL